MNVNKSMVICEYDCLYCGSNDNFLENTLSKKHFDMLENFILSNSNEDASQLMRISQKGNRKIIKAQEYVGLIQLKDGFQIEILPKIHNDNTTNIKRMFLEMLQTIFKIDLKKSTLATLEVYKGSIFEIFIETFIQEVESIIKKGLYSNYEEVCSNENMLKGRLLVNRNLCENYIHKEKFFIQYDVFSKNCSENKLIKSTLLLLKDITNIINRNSIIQLLKYLYMIEPSNNYLLDFSKCKLNRNNANYENALNLARVFLNKKSFSNFSGDSIAYALLFPMNDIFEKYVANLIKKRYLQYDITLQDTSKYLFEEPTKKFNLRPDIVIRQHSKVIYILDTKWKLLDINGIDIHDMYQMYAYSKRFNCDNIILVYPKPSKDTIKETTYHTNDGISISIRFIDLHNTILNGIPINILN